jgi:tetratricopeptide (TPR) repeat protein
MAETAKKEFWTESRLKKGIIWLIVGIVLVAGATAGYWYYLNMPEGSTPPVLQREIDQAMASIKKNPKDLAAHITLAQLYIQNKDYDDAIIECKNVIKADKEKEFAIYSYALMGIAYEGKGEEKTAIANYKKAIDIGDKEEMSRLNPGVVESRFRLGKIYLDQKNWDGALLQFQTVADQNSMDADSRYYLGLTFYRMGQYDQAIESLEKSTQYVPDYFEAFYLLGASYEKKGEKEKAIAAYKQALKGKADYAEAQDALDRLQ